MPKYISFLRGINMAGHYPVKMADLSALYKSLGFNDAETYIQSGNVIFSYEGDSQTADIAGRIESAILRRFSYNVPVMIRTTEELKKILASNPFQAEHNFDPSKMIAIILYEKPGEEQLNKMKGIDYPPDKYEITGNEIFVYCPNGFGRTKLYTNFFEKKLGVIGTARNWKTITALLQLAKNR